VAEGHDFHIADHLHVWVPARRVMMDLRGHITWVCQLCEATTEAHFAEFPAADRDFLR
jgi:hypothetical protein